MDIDVVPMSIMEEFQIRDNDFYVGSTEDLLMKVVNTGADSTEDLMNAATGDFFVDFSNYIGPSSGIPTRTTATLTPTTLKNIEESFLELQSIPPAPMEHQHQAGFVPPSVPPPVVNVAQYQQQHQQQQLPSVVTVKQEMDDDWLPPCSTQQMQLPPQVVVTRHSNNTPAPSPPLPPKPARSGGGRRPNRSEKLSPEEEERRRVRRERNKLAAARCRKRRMDHTNSLIKETEGLEEARSNLQKELADLRQEKENLEFILEAHKASCRVSPLKAATSTASTMSHQRPQHLPITPCDSVGSPSRNNHRVPATLGRAPKFSRPNSLALTSVFTNSDGSSALNNPTTTSGSIPVSCPSLLTEVAGVPIQTPSAGMYSFESIVEGTGATPTGTTPLTFSPVTSCAEQQRNSNGDLSSPDGMNPPKLVSL